MTQFGFFYDQSRCSGCRTCSVACKIWHQLPPGPLKYMRVYEYEKGIFPDIRLHFQWIPCYHCEDPACVNICPFDAIHKEDKYGAVLIDPDKCVGCRLCYDACPYGALVFEGDKLCDSSEDNQIQAPCSEACPVHVNIPRYIGYLGEGKPDEAVAVLREKLPFPSVCGRVCFHPCENACNRKLIDEPVSIRVLKRYATDHDTGLWKDRITVAPKNGKCVAVIGSGPAGLTASYYLAKLGYTVTVFENLEEPGGMMRFGLPEFRLPKDILKEEINYIKELGVEIRTNTPIGTGLNLNDLSSHLGYNAIFIATGAPISRKLEVEGIELEGVMSGIDLMKKINQGENIPMKNKSVVVIGGGNVAVDTAMTVRRLGAREVQMVCLECRDEMPAYKLEITRMEEEGVKLNNSWGLKRIVGQAGKVSSIEIIKCSSVVDEKGKFNPCYDKSNTTFIDADLVILVVGQEADMNALEGIGIKHLNNRVIADESTQETSMKGIFAGGDVVTGSSSVIEAIAAGRKAAGAIDKYLGGLGIIDEILSKPVKKESQRTLADINHNRVNPEDVKPEERVKGFIEIELPLDDQAAIDEAKRCYECDPIKAQKCDMCFDRLESGKQPICVSSCPNRALDFGPLSDLQEKYGNIRDMEDLPISKETKPAVVFKAHKEKKRLIPYDSEKAVQLLMKRDPLPPLFNSLEDLNNIPEGNIGRNKPVFKHKSSDDLMRHTRNDEG